MQLIDLDPHQITVEHDTLREDVGDVSGLAATIAEQGMLQPLGVVQLSDGGYQLLYGLRRRTAAIQLGMTTVPCLVFADEAERNLVRQLTENLQRRDLNDLEQANAFARLRNQFARATPDADEGTLDEAVGQTVGLSARTVRRYLGLLDLDVSIQSFLRTGQLTVTQAQHLRRIGNEQTRIELARTAVDEGMSAAELSRLASFFAANPDESLDSAIQSFQQPKTGIAGTPGFGGVAMGDDTGYLPPELHEFELAAPQPALHGSDAGAYLADDSVMGSSKIRQAKIKSLDHMVDETDRLLRVFAEGQLQRWLDRDENAPIKVGMMIVHLRRLLKGLNDVVQTEQWAIDIDE